MGVKVQYNPSTGKVSYNPATGKVQVSDASICRTLNVNTIKVTWSGLVTCGCVDKDILLSPFSGVRNVSKVSECRWQSTFTNAIGLRRFANVGCTGMFVAASEDLRITINLGVSAGTILMQILGAGTGTVIGTYASFTTSYTLPVAISSLIWTGAGICTASRFTINGTMTTDEP